MALPLRARNPHRQQARERARSARYDAATGRIEVELTNGCLFAFPAELGQGLRGASAAQLAEVEVTPSGTGLHWESLDADLLVSSLLRGVFGSRRWMSELGRLGGQAISPAKAAAARRNGRKGGRPRKGGAAFRREWRRVAGEALVSGGPRVRQTAGSERRRSTATWPSIT